MIYEPPTTKTKEDDCSPWSCKTIKWADDVISNLCSPVLHNDDIDKDKRCDDNTIITHDFDVPQEIHIPEEEDVMPQLISCVRPSRWKSKPACILGVLDILEEYVVQPILTIKGHVFGSCDDEPTRRDGSTKIKRWESKSKATIEKDDIVFSKLLKWSSDEEDASGEEFISESTADRSDRYSMNYRGRSSHLMQ